MDNVTLNQQLNCLVSTEIFESILDEKVKTNLIYYNWLKEYLGNKGEVTFLRNIEYVNNCRMIDENKQISIVYFIRNQYTGLLKIGKTNNLPRRIKEIKNTFTFLGMDTQELVLEAISYCPYGMNNTDVEKYYHHKFKENRINGEWFDITYEDLQCNLIVDYVINGVLVSI